MNVLCVLREFETERNYLLRNLVQDPKTHLFRWLPNLDVLYQSQEIILGFPNKKFDKYSKKCLFIGGKLSDRLKKPEYLPRLYELFPNCQIEMMDTGFTLSLRQA